MNAGKENEGGGAQMRDPARGEQPYGSLRYILWPICREAEKIAHMIQRHDDHDKSAHNVNGLEAGRLRVFHCQIK